MWRLCLVALGACGRIAFDPVSLATTDGALGDGMIGDGAIGACSQWGPFGPPEHLVALGSTTDDWGPSATSDGLTMFLYSNRPGTLGGFDIWMATRASTSVGFGAVVDVPVINSAMEERGPWISSDGLTLGFSSLRGGGPGGLDLWTATRPDQASGFGAPTLLPNVNAAQDELGANLSANGLRLYIASTRAGGGNFHLYVAERATATSAFGVPVAIAGLNSTADDRDIAVSADELEAFIVTNRAGSAGYDIYTATRPDLATPFSTPAPVPGINSALDETSPDISPDGTTLYYNYNAVLAGGDSEIYKTVRACLMMR